MNRPSISTATGDDGTTGLIGGSRVSKADDRVWSFGEIDELNSLIGLVLAEHEVSPVLHAQLSRLQGILFELGADLASPESVKVSRIHPEYAAELEAWGVALEAQLPPLQKFILPGGCRSAALLHQARTVCRRAERCIVAASAEQWINPDAQIYVNRLSDYLFLAARTANHTAGIRDTEWSPPKSA